MPSLDIWKLTVSGVSTLIAATAVAFGVWQYGQESSHNREAADRRNLLEFNRALWQEEFETYRDISSAVGALVAALEMGDETARRQAEQAYRELYWGRAVLVEADTIETQMIKFRRRINQYAEGRLTSDQLKKAAKDLSDALEQAVKFGESAARVGSTDARASAARP